MAMKLPKSADHGFWPAKWFVNIPTSSSCTIFNLGLCYTNRARRSCLPSSLFSKSSFLSYGSPKKHPIRDSPLVALEFQSADSAFFSSHPIWSISTRCVHPRYYVRISARPLCWISLALALCSSSLRAMPLPPFFFPAILLRLCCSSPKIQNFEASCVQSGSICRQKKQPGRSTVPSSYG